LYPPRYQRVLRDVDPLTFLPGTIRVANRFARASFLVNAIPTKLDPHTINAVSGAIYEKQAVAYGLEPQEQGVVLRLGDQLPRLLGSLY
jgi:choloylglycine hydrolase